MVAFEPHHLELVERKEVVRAGVDLDARQEEITRRLLATVRTNAIPAIGFVNEDKLEDTNGRVDPRRVALLRAWLDAGLDLGNHTRSHSDLHKVPVAEYEADILAGEVVTSRLMAAHGRHPRWFRHPYLDTGTSLETRREVEDFLSAHGYRVAPITVDDSEWIIAHAWNKAVAAHDRRMQRRLSRDYVRYLDARFAWYEKKSDEIFGRQIPQILLLHAEALNAAAFGKVVAMLRSRGYRFITLDEAMKDPAYGSKDDWVADGGVSWLVRWGVTRGLPEAMFDGDPRLPEYITKYADYKEE